MRLTPGSSTNSTSIDPELLTCAEKLRYQGYLRRQDSHAVITALVSDGVPLKEIVRRTGHSRNLVRQISRGGGTDMFRTRQSTLDGHLPFLDAQWSGGCRNGAELWRRLKGQGFKGSLRVVAEWTTRRRRAETISHQQLQKVPAARTIAQLMTTKRDHLTRAETVTLAVIEQNVPMLADAQALVGRFHAMIRRKAEIELDLGLKNPSGASLPRSRMESPTIRARCTPLLRNHGPMAKWKRRSLSSSWSNGRCTGALSSISFRLG
ncbi:transposase [Bradyrhizobium sp. GM7.3]